MRHRSVARGVALAALLLPSSALGANWLDGGCLRGPYEGAKWRLSRLPLEWTLGPTCDELGEAVSLEVIQGAWGKWEAVDCAYVSFDYIGRASEYGLSGGGFGELGDGYNNVSWCDGCLGCGGPLGVAQFQVGGVGVMAECDVNIEDCYDWTADPRAAGPGGLMDAQAVAAHETGHCLGLGHTDLVTSTMYEQSQPGIGQDQLDADDIQGLCCIYPLDEGCRHDEDCRDGTFCNEGTCSLTEPGPQGLGWPCDDAAECESGYCALWESEGVCSQECDFTNPAGGCPGGFSCRDLACGTGACIEGALGPTPLGGACGDGSDCSSGLCAEIDGERICGAPCDPLDDRCDGHCEPLGDRCGVCVEGAPPSPVGSPCTDPGDCNYGVCVGVRPDDRRCSKRCGGDWGDCDPGWICEDGICYLEGDGTLGSPCEESTDCVSELCASDGLCTRFCDEEPCPEGFDCVAAGSQSICVPGDGARPFGGPCAENADCRSNLCDDAGGCTRVCSETAPCPPEWECDEEFGVCTAGGNSGPLDTGCGCRVPGAPRGAGGALVLVCALAVMVRRRTASA